MVFVSLISFSYHSSGKSKGSGRKGVNVKIVATVYASIA